MTDAFNAADGDQWFARNKAALETAAEHDWPLKLIERNELKPRRALEVGCANGWRLAEIRRRYSSQGYGNDVSLAAIADGRQRWPELVLDPRLEQVIPLDGCDLAICHFVLHWLERGTLFEMCEYLNDALTDNGHLLLGDFYPDEPTKVPYHHREGLWTYKADYAAIFLATGLYRLVGRVVFDHDSGEEGDWWSIDGKRRAVVSLLQKGDWYQEVGR